MAKKNSVSKSLSEKSAGKNKKQKKPSSRKALVKFAKSETAKSEFKASQKSKPKLAKSVSSDQSIKKHDLKSQAIEPRKETQAFAKADASSGRKMPEDASATLATTNVTKRSSSSNGITDKSQQLSSASSNLLSTASILLAIATGIAILFAIIMGTLQGGQDAVAAMGGVLEATAPRQTAQIVFFLDILFPITFGAGFALLATAFQTRGNRPIVRMILTALLLVVLADFSENALVFKALTGGEIYAVQWPLTVIKYSMLAISAVLLSSVITVQGAMGRLVIVFLRFIFPISIAALVAGFGGRIGSDVIGATFPLGLLLLAIYANALSAK